MVSEDVSTFIIEEMILKYFELEKKYEKTHPTGQDEVTSKDLQNLLSLICCCTRLKLFQTKLVFEVLHRQIFHFSILSLELIRSMFNQSAFTLRKEDPVELKSLISKIHKKAKEKGDELEERGGMRIKFIIEMLRN